MSLSAGLGVGIIGGGFMATVHSRAARAAGARLVGVVASTPERSAAVAAELGAERGFDSVAALLADPAIDVVHVCTPNALHAEQAAAVIAAGLHVVCEKPLTTGAASAAALARSVPAGIVATVPFAYRFHPMVREARARIASGAVGEVLTLNGVYLQDWMLGTDDPNWRVRTSSGGASRAFADIGSHLVDLIEFVTGQRITALAASTRTFFERRGDIAAVETEDAAALTVTLSGGAIGTLLVSQVAPGTKNALRFEISGSAQTLGFDQENPELLRVGTVDGTLLVPRDADRLAPDAARLCAVPSGHPQGYQDAFNAFVADSYAAIGGASPEGLPTFADGARAAALTDAVLAAAADGLWHDTISTEDLA